MPLDGMACHVLAQELAQDLTDMRIERVRQVGRHDYALSCRRPGLRGQLLLCMAPNEPRLYFSAEESRGQFGEPKRFCAFLRKHLTGCRIRALHCPGYERVFHLELEGRNDLGEEEQKTLLVELIPRHSNLILCQHKGIILDALNHVDHSINRYREILPAHPYVAPPQQEQLDLSQVQQILAMRAEIPAQLWSRLDLGEPLHKALARQIRGFSPKLVSLLARSAGVDPGAKVSQLQSADWLSLSQQLQRLVEQTADGHYHYATYAAPGQREAQDFHALAFDVPQLQSYQRFSDCIADYYRQQEEQERLRQQRSQMEQSLAARRRYWERKLALHSAEYEGSAGYERLKEEGDLILAHQGELRPGQKSFRCQDFYHDLEDCTVELAEELGPQANARLRFKQYNKLKARRQRAWDFIQLEQQELAYLRSLEVLLEHAQDAGDLDLIQEEWQAVNRQQGPDPFARHMRAEQDLVEDQELQTEQASEAIHRPRASKARRRMEAKLSRGGARASFAERKALRQQRQTAPARRGQDQPLGPRRYRSSDGFRISVGRNNIQNERLSLRQAKKTDLWFHIQRDAGAHVILHSEGERDFSPRALEEAAGLAVWFSRSGRYAQVGGRDKQAVDYCPQSHLRKARGAKPGMLLYEGYKTLLVEALDPEQLEVLD